MSYIRLIEMAAADVATPATGKFSFFFDTATSEPSYKDDTGAVTSMVGLPGQGVPVGGTSGQVLAKINATDYNTTWANAATDRSTVSAVSSVAGVVTLDYSLGDYFTLTLTENVTSWVIDNAPASTAGFSLIVEMTQGAGPYTVAKPGTVPGGTMTVSTGSGDVDVLAISSLDGGTTLRSNLGVNYS